MTFGLHVQSLPLAARGCPSPKAARLSHGPAANNQRAVFSYCPLLGEIKRLKLVAPESW
jgi:hypothetical protein